MTLPRLHEHEELLAVVRSSLLWRGLVLGFLLFGLTLPCLFFFSVKAFGIELMLFNIATFCALLALFSRAYRSLERTLLVVTNERVIVRSVPWFGPVVEESIPLREIESATFPGGLLLFPSATPALRSLVHDLQGL